MMKKFVFALCTLVLAGCGGSGAPDTRVIHMPAGGALAETVNGTPVPQSLLEAVARSRNWKLDQPQQRTQALRVLTDMILVNQEAHAQNYFADPQFQADLEAARLKSVAEASVAEFEKRTAVSDAVLKSEYDAQIEHTGKSAYDFTQLLFASEDDALKAEADVLAGKPFQQVYDAWRSKARQARAFTRVRLDQVPQDLASVIAAMHDGETTKVPIKTQFGWHVVHLDIVNPYAPPAFDEVKEGIRRNLQMKINRERLEKLRETAKVEYPPGMTPPPSAAPAPAGAQTPPAPVAEKKD
jgi:peptidyl-prolyl cis-trans isomerase C